MQSDILDVGDLLENVAVANLLELLLREALGPVGWHRSTRGTYHSVSINPAATVLTRTSGAEATASDLVRWMVAAFETEYAFELVSQ